MFPFDYIIIFTAVSTHDQTAMYSNVKTTEVIYSDVTEEYSYSIPSQAPTPSFDPLIPCTCPISINDLGTHVVSYHSDSNAGFSQQYQVMTKLFSCFDINFHRNCTQEMINNVLLVSVKRINHLTGSKTLQHVRKH